MSARVRSSASLALAVACGLALAGVTVDARADDQASAEQLFDQGRKLMERPSTLDEACRTLEQSLRLWDRGDTMMNLAECHRRQGKTATAWAEFDKALGYGVKVGFSEAVQTATRLRDMLAAKLSRLRVTVPPATAALEGLVVEVDGKALPRDRWNTAVATDPGSLRVTARAKGMKPFEARVELGPEKDEKSVAVVLEAEPPPPPRPPPPSPPPPAAKPPRRPVWPWVVGGTGLALLTGAIESEIVSSFARGELDANCGAARTSCPRGYDSHSPRSREVIGFGLFVGLGASGVLAVSAAGVGLGLSSGARPRRATSATSATSATLLVSPTSIAVRTAF